MKSHSLSSPVLTKREGVIQGCKRSRRRDSARDSDRENKTTRIHLGNEPSSKVHTSNRSRTVKIPPPIWSRLSPLGHTSVDIDSRIILSQLDRLRRSFDVGLKELIDTLGSLLRLEVWAGVDRVLARRRKRSGCEKVGRSLRVDGGRLSNTFTQVGAFGSKVDRLVVDVTGSVGSDGEEQSRSAHSMSERRHNEEVKECE